MMLANTKGLRHLGERKGNVAAMMACLMPVFIGMMGFAIDGGLLMSQKRHTQAATDASAMAAACIMYQYYGTLYNGSSDNVQTQYKNAATAAAQNMAATYGYNNDGSLNGSNTAGTSVVQVNFVPNITKSSIYNSGANSPNYEGQIRDGCVEVIITYYQMRFFSTIWGTGSVVIQGRAVAKGASISPKTGVIVLDYDPYKGALADKGGGSLKVMGGGIVVNSSEPTAAVQITGGGIVYADELDVTGGVTAPVGSIITSPDGNIFSGVHPSPDPLRNLPLPSQPAAGSTTFVNNGSGFKDYILTPGSYTKLPNIGNGDNLIFSGDGIYWFDTDVKLPGGSMTMATGTAGIMIYQNTGTFNANGGAGSTFNLAPMQTGVYKGLLFWEPSTNTNGVGVQGSGNAHMSGTFYAPGALLTVSGNGSGATGASYGSQFISKHFTVTGTGDVFINYSGDNAVDMRMLTLVE